MKKTKARPIKAYAVVNILKPHLSVFDIYTKDQAKELVYNKKTERLVPVLISILP